MDGLVMKTSDDKAVILLKSGEFRCVKNCGYHVGENIRLKKKPIAFIILAVLVILSVIGFSAAYFIPASYISIDINPSIVLDVNCFGDVIKADALTDDANPITNILEKDSVDDMIEDIVEIAYRRGMLDEYPTVAVTTYNASRSILRDIYDIEFDIPVNYIVQEAEKEDMEIADEEHISFGKVCLIRKYSSGNETLDDLKDKSAAEIIGDDNSEISYIPPDNSDKDSWERHQRFNRRQNYED